MKDGKACKGVRSERKDRENKSGLTKAARLIFIGALLFVFGALCLRQIFPIRYSQEVQDAAREFSLSQGEVYAVIWTESKFDKHAVSYAGARGLMQLMPSTAEWCAAVLQEPFSDERLFLPELNIRLGCFYLNYLKSKFDGDDVYAAYNAGENRVLQWQQSGQGIQLEETRQYVKRVNFAKKIYALLYGSSLKRQ